MSSKLEDLPDYKEEQEAIGENKHEISLERLENYINTDPTQHNWRQKGPYLVCTSCKSRHAIYLGLDKILKTTKSNGEIVLEKLQPLR